MTNVFTSNVDSSCNATINIEMCNIHSAVVSYDLVIHNESVTIDFDRMPASPSPVPSRGDLPSARQGNAAGVLAGLEWLGHYYLQSNATLNHNETEDSYNPINNGMLAFQYSELDQDDYSNFAACAFQYRNPTNDLIEDLYEVVFRLAIDIGNSMFVATLNSKYIARS